MKITKNKRGGFKVSGNGDLYLSKHNKWLFMKDFHDSDFTDFHVEMNSSKRKFQVLKAVIKWLYEN